MLLGNENIFVFFQIIDVFGKNDINFGDFYRYCDVIKFRY